MANDMMVKELEQVVVRFSGDSGDGMQLAGNIFSTVSATVGNDISTFPDYPAESAPRKAHSPVFPVFRYISVQRKSIPQVTNATYW
jgi:Pyruvate/2-oxoacid:ferredoxin oxidoreductase gamma subunit